MRTFVRNHSGELIEFTGEMSEEEALVLGVFGKLRKILGVLLRKVTEDARDKRMMYIAVMDPIGNVDIYYTRSSPPDRAPEELGTELCYFNGRAIQPRSVPRFVREGIRYSWLNLARRAVRELDL